MIVLFRVPSHLETAEMKIVEASYLKELVIIRLGFQVAAVLDCLLKSGCFGRERHAEGVLGVKFGAVIWGVVGMSRGLT